MFKKLILVAFLSGMNFTYAQAAAPTTTPTIMHPDLGHIHRAILARKEIVDSKLAAKKQFVDSLKELASKDLRAHVTLQDAQKIFEELKAHSFCDATNYRDGPKTITKAHNIEDFLNAIVKLTPNKSEMFSLETGGASRMLVISLDSNYDLKLSTVS